MSGVKVLKLKWGLAAAAEWATLNQMGCVANRSSLDFVQPKHPSALFLRNIMSPNGRPVCLFIFSHEPILLSPSFIELRHGPLPSAEQLAKYFKRAWLKR